MRANNININETIVIDGDDDDEGDNDVITVDNVVSTSPVFKKNPFSVWAKTPPSRKNELEVMASNTFSHVKKKLKVSDGIQNDTIIVLTDDDDDDDYGDDGNNNNAQSQTFSHQSPVIINDSEKSPIENTQTKQAKQTNTKKRPRKKKLILTESFMSFDNEQVPDGNKKESPKQQKTSKLNNKNNDKNIEIVDDEQVPDGNKKESPKQQKTSKLNNKKNDKNIETVDDEIEVVWHSNPTDTNQAPTNNDALFWYDPVGTSSNLEVLGSWDTPFTENPIQNDPITSNIIYQNSLNKSAEVPGKKTCNNKALTTPVNTNNTNACLNYINGYAVSSVRETRQNKAKTVNPTSTNVSINNINRHDVLTVRETRQNKAKTINPTSTNVSINNLNTKAAARKPRKKKPTAANPTSTSVTQNNLNDNTKTTVKKTPKNKGKKRVKRKRQISETYVYDSSDEIDESKQNENESLNTEKSINDDNNKITKKQNLNNDKLRVIVVDGSNVAMAHSNNKSFSIKGIELIIKYFTSRGHKVKVFLSRRRDKGKDKKLLDKWYKEGIVVFTPSRKVDTKRITPYDDRFILEYATQIDGIVVSSDQFRDLYEEKPEWRKTIKTRILPPTFVDDYVMFPQDPLGCKGPSLDKFLRH
ncbi:putative uncharacterized protein DDB_G0282499 isoform X2 [Aphidius gifuensis]|uniref:putative uncharacterized protein DDB_G0282499 isoform X2 n=1 Tax=Aphidius gifuensis TaxID=684658 RepID=UPI001CDC6D29|nr:putative uncharacterized protein DDB_G0282499 isoform X2 [Aphidius gifuensis]